MGVETIEKCKCVLIVTKNSVKRLAVALGYKNIDLISFEEASRNWLQLMRIMGEHLDVQNAVYHGLNHLFQTLVHYSQVNFRDSFTKYVFQFKEEVKPIYPIFPGRKNHVLNQFKEHGLKPGKTVVISPYAGHFIAQIKEAHWNKLIYALKKKGYTICTNTGGAEERPLQGTCAPFIELQDCVEFVETAGYFIGVRSGFCDLVCMADCLKIVIYETGAPAASIDFFGFENMNIGSGDIIEVINDCINTNKMIDTLLTYF
jgi:ADP-heptose:LPS heptosyltransferase